MNDNQATAAKPSIAVGIVSWQGKHINADKIARSLAILGIDVYVVHSDSSGIASSGAGLWTNVPNEWFYGKKFEALINQFIRYDWYLFIQADVTCADWPSLISALKNSIYQYPNMGAWTAETSYSYFDQACTAIHRVKKDEYLTTTIDGLCWAISGKVLDFMKTLSYTTNNYGWGIELAVASYCHHHSLLILNNSSVLVNHPKGSGYSKDTARSDQDKFLLQLPVPARLLIKGIFGYTALKKGYRMAVKPLLGALSLSLLIYLNYFISIASKLKHSVTRLY